MASLKYSKQREAIHDFLKTRKDHPTAETVYTSLKPDYPNLSLGTVYRNLSLLADLGEIARFRVGDGTDHFDYNISPHYHFVCSQCGSVMDLEMDSIDQIENIAGMNFDGRIFGHMTYFYGICGSCCHQETSDAPVPAV